MQFKLRLPAHAPQQANGTTTTDTSHMRATDVAENVDKVAADVVCQDPRLQQGNETTMTDTSHMRATDVAEDVDKVAADVVRQDPLLQQANETTTTDTSHMRATDVAEDDDKVAADVVCQDPLLLQVLPEIARLMELDPQIFVAGLLELVFNTLVCSTDRLDRWVIEKLNGIPKELLLSKQVVVACAYDCQEALQDEQRRSMPSPSLVWNAFTGMCGVIALVACVYLEVPAEAQFTYNKNKSLVQTENHGIGLSRICVIGFCFMCVIALPTVFLFQA
jgi:hypothetical protein